MEDGEGMGERVILAVAKVHGKGRVQIPKQVREALKIEDGGRVYFIQDELGRIYIEKAPTLRRERKGKYAVVESPL